MSRITVTLSRDVVDGFRSRAMDKPNTRETRRTLKAEYGDDILAAYQLGLSVGREVGKWEMAKRLVRTLGFAAPPLGPYPTKGEWPE
jgi:hypothetical protein